MYNCELYMPDDYVLEVLPNFNKIAVANRRWKDQKEEKHNYRNMSMPTAVRSLKNTLGKQEVKIVISSAVGLVVFLCVGQKFRQIQLR